MGPGLPTARVGGGIPDGIEIKPPGSTTKLSVCVTSTHRFGRALGRHVWRRISVWVVSDLPMTGLTDCLFDPDVPTLEVPSLIHRRSLSTTDCKVCQHRNNTHLVGWQVESLWQFSWPTALGHHLLALTDVYPNNTRWPAHQSALGWTQLGVLHSRAALARCLLAGQVLHVARHLTSARPHKRVYITLDRTHILSTTEAFHLPPGCCRRFASPGQPFPITRTCGVHRSKALWNNDLPKVTCTYCALRQPRPKAASPPSASVPVPACLATITAYIEPNRRPYALAIPAWPVGPAYRRSLKPAKVLAIASVRLRLVVGCPICKGCYHYRRTTAHMRSPTCDRVTQAKQYFRIQVIFRWIRHCQ